MEQVVERINNSLTFAIQLDEFGVWAKIKDVAPNDTFTHCVIHRENLAARKMPPQLKQVLDTAVKIINFVKSRPLNVRLLATLCTEMAADHEHLLLHTEVRWLSRGRILNPLTAISRSSGYKLFVTRYRQPAFRIEHYMQKRAVSRCYG